MKIILLVLFVILELPFLIKFIQAHKKFEITRQIAILVIMGIIAAVFYGIFMLI